MSQEQEKTAAQLAEQMEESKRLHAEKKRLEEETNMLQVDLEVSFDNGTQLPLQLQA